VITGQLDRVGSSYSLLLRLVRAGSGEVLAAENRTAGNDDALMPALEQTVRALREGLGERRASLDAERPMPEVMTPSFAAYQRYAEAVRLSWDAGDYNGARERFREALALDPGFAAAWIDLGYHYFQYYSQPDSGWAAWEEADRHSERMTNADRLRLTYHRERRRYHFNEALRATEELVRERPNDARAWNSRGVMVHYMGQPEAMLEALDHIAITEPFETQYRIWNRTFALIMLGRRAEARAIALSHPNDRERLSMLLNVAVLDGAWADVDSLTPLYERAYIAEYDRPDRGRSWRRVLHLARGEVRAAKSLEAGSTGARFMLLWELAAGSPIARADTGWAGAFEAALAGDTSTVRAALTGLTADPLDYRVQSGYWTAAIEVAAAGAREDWSAVVERGVPLLRERPAIGPVLGTGVRWLAAHAYERLGKLDSASTLLGELVEPGRLDPPTLFTQVYGAANSYLRQHLIVLLARTGEIDEARRHWEILRTTFTNPDPEYAHLIDEARSALEAAEAKGRGR
jgi:tetratricopeptide (TPR) repeat protein